MNGFRLWKIHRAVSLHLLTVRYNVFESHGAVKNTSLEQYEKFRGRGIFEQIARYIDTPVQGTQFFLANIVYSGKDNTFYDLDMGFTYYKTWIKHKESLTAMIKDDLDVLNLPQDLSGNPPRLLKGLLSGNVLPQTCSAINEIVPFCKDWNKENYFGSGKFPLIISKLNRFIQYDRDQIHQLIKEKISEAV